ncbi:MAG: efflux RND transporter periplasmic adaptor subunit, partial [Candidatus Kapabacteria bacterium]|nr:efflux RND transporter periplasmic adaptor subunit [Candidatus Kapabacteria bacterium]
GRVAFIYPVVNAESRTVKVRIETQNPHGRLRPAMYTETVFTLNGGTGLTIPDDAVLVTGKQRVVWVQVRGETNKFEARHVTTGAKFDGKVQILSGLSEGEKVVASGGFLLDSERQLRGGAGGGHQH